MENLIVQDRKKCTTMTQFKVMWLLSIWGLQVERLTYHRLNLEPLKF